MAKRSRNQVKKDEDTIIRVLQSHAKENIDELAKRCHFSGPKVRRIIKKLEENGTIWGYHAVTNYEKINKNEYLLLIKKTNMPLEKLAKKIISRDFDKKAEELDIMIGSSYYLHGIFDWIICFVADDLPHAKRFESELVKMYKPFISETQLIENIFPVKRFGITNPNVEELKQFL
ncbi:MAG: Lrp/AsnC family transcriptional regulator [Candidatus Thermoplasmatota archaeon]|nr:Lrp/AsnC family transcriptional regulator [Candidatus Thermoplasmatota archaeon]